MLLIPSYNEKFTPHLSSFLTPPTNASRRRLILTTDGRKQRLLSYAKISCLYQSPLSVDTTSRVDEVIWERHPSAETLIEQRSRHHWRALILNLRCYYKALFISKANISSHQYIWTNPETCWNDFLNGADGSIFSRLETGRHFRLLTLEVWGEQSIYSR